MKKLEDQSWRSWQICLLMPNWSLYWVQDNCLLRDRSCFHERAAQVVVRIDWTRSALQSSQSLQVMINWCRCHNFTFFQDYTLYIQLENAIPLGHLQAAISRKRKELPEIQRACCLISFSMYTMNTHYLQDCKSWNLEINAAAQSTSRSLSHREQVHKCTMR